MPRVRCHDLSDVIVHTPGARRILAHFARRAVLDSSPDDIIVLPRQSGVPPEVNLLHRLIGSTSPRNIRNSFRGLAGTQVEPFSGTGSWLRRQALRYDFQVAAPPIGVCWRVNDKGQFQRYCSNLPGTHLLPGYVCRPNRIKETVRQLHAETGTAARVKATRSATGNFQETVLPGMTPKLNGKKGGPTAYVVQPEAFWGRTDRVVEVSVQFEIKSDGQFEIGPVTGNVTVDNKHVGNYYPAHQPPPGFTALPQALEAELITATAQIIQHFSIPLGYWGYGSIDFIVNIDTGEFYAIDPNKRYGGPRYPINLSMRLFGEVRPFNLRGMSIPQDMTLTQLEELFAPIMFDREKERGFIPFTFLPEFGYCNTLNFGRTVEERNWLIKRFEALKLRLVF